MAAYHIDTDMGVDDALALVVATKLPGFSLLAVSTVFGNVPVDTATRNALIFRHLLRLPTQFEVLQGADRATDGFFRDASHVHGRDGLGGAAAALDGDIGRVIDRQPARQLDRLDGAGAGGQPVTIIGLGPATNIPSLVDGYGRRNVAHIVLMTGVFFDRGNITPMAEFNAHCDPAALQATVALGVPITLVPLDVCRKVQLSPQTVQSYIGLGDATLMQLVVDAHNQYMSHYREWEGIEGCFPHDTIAVLVAYRPDRFFSIRANVTVDASEMRGRTSLELDDRSHIHIVTGGDLRWVRNFLHQLNLG